MHQERQLSAQSGWAWLVVNILLYLGAIGGFIFAAVTHQVLLLIPAVLVLIANIFVTAGFFVVNPNEAVVVLLFGEYKGTCNVNGFRYANPFFTKKKISMKARTLNGDRLKVNDKVGNPIEIAAVVVWQVSDTARALFDVDHYSDYVTTQSETALRHLASRFSYDGEDEDVTLRGATDEVNEELMRELQERLARAGVTVLEARLSHLAYAQEIAHAMLQRQQAQAVVSARKKIVEGAVGMVEMALHELQAKHIVELPEDKKADLVGNLLVVLCSEHAAQPVIQAGH